MTTNKRNTSFNFAELMQLDDRELYKMTAIEMMKRMQEAQHLREEKMAQEMAQKQRLHEEKMKARDDKIAQEQRLHEKKMAEYQKQAKAEEEERALRMQKLRNDLRFWGLLSPIMAAIVTAVIGLIFAYIFGTTPFANQSNNQPQTPVQNQQIVHSQPN